MARISASSVAAVLLFLVAGSYPTLALSPLRMMSSVESGPFVYLDQKSFHRALESGGKQWMVVFCNVDRSGPQPEPTGDCRKLMPAFEKYAKEKTHQMERLAYGEVDCGTS